MKAHNQTMRPNMARATLGPWITVLLASVLSAPGAGRAGGDSAGRGRVREASGLRDRQRAQWAVIEGGRADRRSVSPDHDGYRRALHDRQHPARRAPDHGVVRGSRYARAVDADSGLQVHCGQDERARPQHSEPGAHRERHLSVGAAHARPRGDGRVRARPRYQGARDWLEGAAGLQREGSHRPPAAPPA